MMGDAAKNLIAASVKKTRSSKGLIGRRVSDSVVQED